MCTKWCKCSSCGNTTIQTKPIQDWINVHLTFTSTTLQSKPGYKNIDPELNPYLLFKTILKPIITHITEDSNRYNIKLESPIEGY